MNCSRSAAFHCDVDEYTCSQNSVILDVKLNHTVKSIQYRTNATVLNFMSCHLPQHKASKGQKKKDINVKRSKIFKK